MTIKQALKLALGKLRKTSETPWLDAEVLLGYVLKADRTWLSTYPEKKLTKKQYQKFQNLVRRRIKHEPVAYITNQKEFYGLDFYVDENVLIPRPETEMLVETVAAELALRPLLINIADIGTGSGCIACALVKNIDRPVQIYTTDISSDILRVARGNAKRHKVLNKINFLKGNLLEPLIKVPDIDSIVANLPYLTTKQWCSTIPKIRLYEPRQALDGGKDGLNYIKKLLFQASQRKDIKTIILEIGGKRQANKIKKLAKKYWLKCKIKIKKDLRELDRVIIIFTE